jgi:DNA-directed RNA polymerase subunit RPC12/RpoP
MKYKPPKCLFCKKAVQPSNSTEKYLFCEECAQLWLVKLKNVMENEDGRAVIKTLLRVSSILNTDFTGSSVDAYNAGKKVIGTWLLKECVRADIKAGQNIIFEYLQE